MPALLSEQDCHRQVITATKIALISSALTAHSYGKTNALFFVGGPIKKLTCR